MVRDALSDGVVDHTEHKVLKDYSLDMGIKEEEAMSLLKQESATVSGNPAFSTNRSDCCHTLREVSYKG